MTLLQGNSEGCEAVLRGEGLAGSRGEQEPNHLVMVLLQTPTLLYWDTVDGSESHLERENSHLFCGFVYIKKCSAVISLPEPPCRVE